MIVSYLEERLKRTRARCACASSLAGRRKGWPHLRLRAIGIVRIRWCGPRQCGICAMPYACWGQSRPSAAELAAARTRSLPTVGTRVQKGRTARMELCGRTPKRALSVVPMHVLAFAAHMTTPPKYQKASAFHRGIRRLRGSRGVSPVLCAALACCGVLDCPRAESRRKRRAPNLLAAWTAPPLSTCRLNASRFWCTWGEIAPVRRVAAHLLRASQPHAPDPNGSGNPAGRTASYMNRNHDPVRRSRQ